MQNKNKARCVLRIAVVWSKQPVYNSDNWGFS